MPSASATRSAIIFDSFDWRHRHIRVYRPRDAHFNRNVYGHRREIYRSNWQHNAYHRRGVNYKNASVWRKYAKGDKARPKPGFAARPKPGKPPKAVYKGKGGPPQIAKGKGGGKGKSADAKGRAPRGCKRKIKRKKRLGRPHSRGRAADQSTLSDELVGFRGDAVHLNTDLAMSKPGCTIQPVSNRRAYQHADLNSCR
jgi:hypothetical protein